MDAEFWHSRWAENRIGFHLPDVNPLLIKHWSAVKPQRDERVLVPMCGKTQDLVWLAERHNQVIGIELSDIAVKAFFAENLYTPLVTGVGNQHLYEFDEISIYQGDYFTVNIEPVDVVYDRAALIAMPEDMRQMYVEKLLSLVKPGGRILLVTLDYPQDELAGPPFSVPKAEVEALFANCKVTHLERDDADETHPRRQRGLSRFAEEVWLIEV
ncbi:thiopurine S-methyltransferase [Photobacterium leiognathi]|uniref:Thiopurine S-methyltransferase n=2 Tax=Photobacterium leiognathi TaxID=553611 RepID=X0NNA2_PHOLE|nr:thiopurine S-methyltransferase [Photobacterium leiognathi]PSW56615.1 thiopurine S-methyltransferase [Photobacterium leiognathi subsp. mandapamensis]GAD29482.1 thiopurine S-methyltransferase, Se/Te detoxification family [Photobacterium leiognathi lrivu.4.1]